MAEDKADVMISNLTSAGNKDAERLELGAADVGGEQQPAEPAGEETEPDGKEVSPEGGEPVAAAPAEGEGEGEKTPPSDFVTREDFDRVHKEAVKRRHLVKDLKLELREQGENISALRELMINPPTPATPEEQAIAADPAVQMIRGDIQSLREDAGLTPEQMRATQQNQEQTEEYKEVVEYVNESREKFETAHPDYQEALQFALEKRVTQIKRIGYDEATAREQVGIEMQDMCSKAFENGEDPSKMAYDMAVDDYGWTGKASGDDPEPKESSPPPVPPRTMDSVARIKAGMQQQSVAAMGGDRGGVGSETARAEMTRDQFYAQVEPGMRIQILANTAKFEELAKTGKITVDWV